MRHGDPLTSGVVWPRIAELALLVAIGGGSALLRFVLDTLKAEERYEYVVCQATFGAVGFYEKFGFTRVGAIARYTVDGTSEDELRQVPFTAYRHWAEANALDCK